MQGHQIARAWKDPAYRATLNPAERAALPAHPAGDLALSDAELGLVAGGVMSTEHLATVGCCGGLTTDPGLCSLFCMPGTGQCTLPCCGGTGPGYC